MVGDSVKEWKKKLNYNRTNDKCENFLLFCTQLTAYKAA